MSEGNEEADGRVIDQPTIEQRTEDASEVAKTVRRLYLGLLGFGVYLIITLSVEDAVLVRADAEIEIPVFGVGVDLSRILLFAPICLVALTFYLHLFYGQLETLHRAGARISHAYLFTLPSLPARVATNLILYATLPLVLAWSSWKALFRAEAPVLVALTIASAVVLALLHDYRGRSVVRRVRMAGWLTTGLTAALVSMFVGYAALIGWQGLIESREIDLVGADLSRADLRRVNLRNLNLTRARLDGADLFDADLRGANLTGAVLREAQLIGANLSGANLSGADLHAARFKQPLDEVQDVANDPMGEVETLPHCPAESSADMSDANLRGARLSMTILRDVDLQRAELTDADLRQADLSCANVSSATMTGANMIRVTAQRLRGQRAILDSARLGKADLRGALLVQASLVNANLDQAIIGDTSLAWADLTAASLRELDLRGQLNLIGATLTSTTPDASEICADEKQVRCSGVERSRPSAERQKLR